MDRSPEPPSPVDSPADDITLVLPEPTQPVAPASPPPPRRSRLWVAALIVGVVIAGAGVAVALVLSRGDRDESTVARATTPSPSPSPTILAPTGLTAEAGAFGVELSWTQPPGGGQIVGYSVYRNGDLAGRATPPATTFTDDEVDPGKDYTYELAATGVGIVSERASVTVKTKVPPLRAARVEGTFDVRAKQVSQFGYIEDFEPFTLGWRFRPKCDSGPCDIVWSDVLFRSFRATLDRKGLNYSGSDSGRWTGQCGTVTNLTATMTIEFRVVKARGRGGEWRATRLVGTLVERHPSMLGCSSGGADFTITARLTSA
ncbi:MAG: fibronectin type III domain-containing protein [Actinomycetota bacterium]